MLLLLNVKIYSAMCRWKLVGMYFWGKMKGRWRMNIMKDLIQARTADFFNGNFFNRRAQTCIFKSWMNK